MLYHRIPLLFKMCMGKLFQLLLCSSSSCLLSYNSYVLRIWQNLVEKDEYESCKGSANHQLSPKRSYKCPDSPHGRLYAESAVAAQKTMRSMYVTWQQLLLRQTVHCCTRFGEMNVATAAFKDTSTLSKVCLFVGTLLTALLRSDRHGKSNSPLHGALLNLFLCSTLHDLFQKPEHWQHPRR